MIESPTNNQINRSLEVDGKMVQTVRVCDRYPTTRLGSFSGAFVSGRFIGRIM